MSLTDTRRLWSLAAKPEGIHSHDARKLGVSGNPSQRAKDCADHVAFWTKRERRNGRPGSRYWADGYQPADASPVRPNDAGRSHDPSPSEGVMEQTPPVVVPPSADAEGGGGIEGEPAQATVTPLSAEPLSWCWSKQTGWVQRPVREVLAGWGSDERARAA